MQVGGPSAAFLELLAATTGAGFVAPHLWLHGFRDRALVDCDPEWHPVSVDGREVDVAHGTLGFDRVWPFRLTAAGLTTRAGRVSCLC